MESNKKNTSNLNLTLKIIHANIANSKLKLEEYLNTKFLIKFTKVNLLKDKDNRIRKFTKQKQLIEDTIYFNDEVIEFNNVDLEDENLEICIIFLLSNKTYKTTLKVYNSLKILYNKQISNNINSEFRNLFTLSEGSSLKVMCFFSKENANNKSSLTYRYNNALTDNSNNKDKSQNNINTITSSFNSKMSSSKSIGKILNNKNTNFKNNTINNRSCIKISKENLCSINNINENNNKILNTNFLKSSIRSNLNNYKLYINKTNPESYLAGRPSSNNKKTDVNINNSSKKSIVNPKKKSSAIVIIDNKNINDKNNINNIKDKNNKDLASNSNNDSSFEDSNKINKSEYINSELFNINNLDINILDKEDIKNCKQEHNKDSPENIRKTNTSSKLLSAGPRKTNSFKRILSPDKKTNYKRKLTNDNVLISINNNKNTTNLDESNINKQNNNLGKTNNIPIDIKDKLLDELNCKKNNNVSKSKNIKSCIQTDLIELEYNDYNEYELGDHLIETVFIAGMPKCKSKVILDSERNTSNCKHSNCSILTAFKPEILAKFPKKGREAVEITDGAASLCFTKGIKPCFASDEKKIPIIEDYLSIITNEGERYFLYNYHFYAKFNYIKEQNNFDFFKKWREDLHLSSEKIDLISNFSLKEHFYLPYCLCIVSKFPITSQSKICIQSLINIAFKDNDYFENISSGLNDSDIFNKDINYNYNNDYIDDNQSTENFKFELNKNQKLLFQLLKHLTYEVPFPSQKELRSRTLKLYLPYAEHSIEIASGKYSLEMPLLSYNLDILYDYFSTENIVIIYHLILLEQKLLFVSKSASTISKILECFKSIIYPFVWCNSFVSVVSEDLLKFLQCIIPFMMGIEDSLLIQGKEYLETNDDVYIIYIDKNTIEDYSKQKKITRKVLKTITGDLNNNEYEKLETSLKEILDYKTTAINKKSKINNDSLNYFILKTFATYLVSILGNYHKYLSYIEDLPCFNLELFLTNINPKYSKFYSEIIQSQNFQSFIQNNPQQNELFNKLILKYSGQRKTNVNKKPSGIIGLFSKSKVLDISVKDILHNTTNSTDVNSKSGNNSAYSDNFSKNIEDKSLEYINEYIVPPFFINYPLVESDKIEEYVIKFNKNKSINENNRVFCGDKLNNFVNNITLFSEDKDIFKRVVLTTKEDRNPEVTLIKKSTSYRQSTCNKNSSKSDVFKKVNEINVSKEFESKNEIIKDYIRKALTSQQVTDIEKKQLINVFQSKYGRKSIASLIYQDKFNSNKVHQLSETGYEAMLYLVVNALVLAKFQEEEMNDIIRITKSCFHYYKINTNKSKEPYFLYKDIIKNHSKVWDDEQLWRKWYYIELDNLNNEEFAQLKKSPEELYTNKFFYLFNFMNDLKLDTNLIYIIIEKISVDYLSSEESREFLMKVVKKQLDHRLKAKQMNNLNKSIRSSCNK